MKIENCKLKIGKGFRREAKRNGGFSLVEVVVAVSVATLSILAILNTYTLFVKISLSNPSIFQASFLAEEGVEAVKFMRDNGWSSSLATFSNGTSYTLVFDGLTWGVGTTPLMVDSRFDRRVVFSEVYRDVFGNINSAGSLDLNTKKVVVTVSWQRDAATSTREITTYVSNIFNN